MIKTLNFAPAVKLSSYCSDLHSKKQIWTKSKDLTVEKYLANIYIILLKILLKSLIFCTVRNMGSPDYVVVIWTKLYRFVEKNGLKFKSSIA